MAEPLEQPRHGAEGGVGMTAAVRGWCPGALRPMQAADGLILRIRPRAARLSTEQGQGIAELARDFGNGEIGLGSRGNLQIRGLKTGDPAPVQRALDRLGLLDPDAGIEARRNILVTPFRQGGAVPQLVAALEGMLSQAPDLPAKFGLAVDCGKVAVLGEASADLRIERGREGGLILRADGMERGETVTVSDAPARILALMHWFAAHRGEYRRMAPLVAAGVRPPLAPDDCPGTGAKPRPGPIAGGFCLALPFGRIEAETFHALAERPLCLLPWRLLVVEGAERAPTLPGLITDAADPLLRVSACTGAPGCAHAGIRTRQLAQRIAPLVPQGRFVHVSGCAKGCAHPCPADLTLTGRAGRVDLVVNGAAGDPPLRSALDPARITDSISTHL